MLISIFTTFNSCYIAAMKQALISILIPFKNTQDYIGECLQSIINQTYNDWELIIIDDSSTDNSYNIVNAFAEKHSCNNIVFSAFETVL